MILLSYHPALRAPLLNKEGSSFNPPDILRQSMRFGHQQTCLSQRGRERILVRLRVTYHCTVIYKRRSPWFSLARINIDEGKLVFLQPLDHVDT